MEDRIDARIYGFEGFSTAPIHEGAVVQAVTAPSQVDQVSVLTGSNDAQIGAGNLVANNRERATALESFGAGVSTWTTSDLVRRWNRPDFTPVPNFDSKAANKAVPFALTSEQYMELRNTQSPEEHQYWVDNMERVNTARTASGDHPIVSGIATIADPAWFGIDAVTLGAGKAARLAGAGRAVGSSVQGVVGAGSAFALGKAAQRDGMADEHEVWLGAMIMGSIGAATYKQLPSGVHLKRTASTWGVPPNITQPGIAVQATPMPNTAIPSGHNAGNAPSTVGSVYGMVPNDPMFPAAALRRSAQELEAAHTPQLLQEGAADFVGPVQVHKAPLTQSRVPATGEGAAVTTYGPTQRGRFGTGVNTDHFPDVPLTDAQKTALNNAENVHIVDTVDDIAELSKDVAKGRIRIAKDAKAVYLPGDDKVVLIKGNLKAGDDVKGIVLHEVGVHMNAERVLGVQAVQDMLTRLEDLALAGNKRAKQAFADVPKDTHGSLVREEALGYYIERYHKDFSDTIVARMVAGVKLKLRDLGFKAFKLTEADIVYMIRKSAKNKNAGTFDAVFPYIWHGSPTSGIEKLQSKFIGSGEGGAKYGWGHYLTSEKGTALIYRNQEAIKRGAAPDSGGLYRVKLRGKITDYLDLDSKVQSASVQSALDTLGVPRGGTGWASYKWLTDNLGKTEGRTALSTDAAVGARNLQAENITAGTSAASKAASEALLQAGVLGNRFATGRTRYANVKSSNYVAFGDDVLDIEARYSKVETPLYADAVDSDIDFEAKSKYYTHGNSTEFLKDGTEVEVAIRSNEYGSVVLEVSTRDGEVVGTLDYSYTRDYTGAIMEVQPEVAEHMRRKGVASLMYDLAEKDGGLIPPLDSAGAVRTELGHAFRNAREAKRNLSADTQVRYSKGLGVTTQQQAARTVAQKFAGALEISLHKTMSNYSKRGNEIADMLVADPLDKSGNSVASIRRAVRADMSRPQYVYEDLLAKAMSAKGAGTAKRIFNSAESTRIQRGIEKDVYMELLRRNRLALDGMPVNSAGIDPVIAKMADAHEVATDLALAERKRAGVLGAGAVQESRGYVTRRWDNAKIQAIQAEIESVGPVRYGSRQVLIDNVSIGLQRANGWDAELAGDVAKAILDRARSQGYFEDTVLRKHAGQDALAEVRNLLTGTGISDARMQRVLDVLAGKADEGGKNATLKHRVDISMDEAITLPNGERRAISDMLDTGIATHLERYLDGAAADVAFARKGLTERSAVSNLRKELAHSIDDVTKRQEAVEMFDNTVSAIRGEPTGEKMHEYMRNSAAITQMVSLGASALWQATEYATVMMHYGAGRTMAAAFKELPIIRNILGDKLESTHLREVLSSNAAQDMRIRPFINRMEDGFEIAPSAQVQLALQQAKQLVPYINGMKYIQSHQARMTGNLIVSTLQRAAKGDAKAAKALEAYGLESHVLAAVSQDIASVGMDTAKWSKATWEAVRTPLTKMVDESVLRANTGDIPAFAQFSQVGKFLFTFRGFVLAAHNKVLSSTLHNQGFAGLGLTMLYQFPLTIMATAANNTISGKKEMTEDKLLKAAFTQMGSLGLLSELAGVALGNKQQFGSPGTIAIDKAYKLGGAVASGDLGNIGAATLNTIPLLSTFLPMKAIGESLKGN